MTKGTYAELTNGRVWYDEIGQGDPLVLLHGGAVDSRFFERNVGALAEHFRVITAGTEGGNSWMDELATRRARQVAEGGRMDALVERLAERVGGRASVQAVFGEPKVGYLEMRDGQATFRPIRDPYPSPAFLLAAGVAGAFVVRALARVAARRS